jgi:hypothetical protein
MVQEFALDVCRVYTAGVHKKLAEVRYRVQLLSLFSTLTKLTGLLPRSRYVETLDTPEHRTTCWVSRLLPSSSSQNGCLAETYGIILRRTLRQTGLSW